MGHTFIRHLYHIVFSTKGRRCLLKTPYRKRLFEYMRGIANHNRTEVLALNAMDDHLHLCVALGADIAVSKFVQDIKGSSSRWMSKTFPEQHIFAWQAGYGSFSVSQSMVQSVIDYISNQEAHHKTKDFAAELRELIILHKVDFNPDYFLD